MQFISSLKTFSQKLFKTGFFHIFGAGTLNKVISALLSIILVRILSKEDYGTYSYVFNIVSFFVILNGLGAVSTLLQLGCERAEDETERERIFAYGTRVGIRFDVALALCILIVSFTVSLSFSGANYLLGLYCLYPLVLLLFDLRLTWFRVMLKNREYALFTNIQTVLLAFFSIAGALIYSSVGLVLGQYIAYVLSWIIVVFRQKRSYSLRSYNIISKSVRDEYWHIALISTLNVALSQALPLVGVFLVGLMTASESAVAEYKVATTIPFALLFIPGTLITYIYPYFARNRNKKNWTMRNYGKVTISALVVFGAITLVCIILAQPLIVLVFGAQYQDAVSAFIVLMIGFWLVASLRQPAGNLLVTQKKLGFNFLMGVLALAVCLALSLFLIPSFGIEGAAWAYVGSMAVGAICMPLYYLRTIWRIDDMSCE